MSKAVRAAFVAVEGDAYFVVEWSAPSADGLARLTEAERQVAELVATGASNEEIARARGRSARTIANQLASIMRKLGVGSRTGIAGRCARNR